eukprot:Gb_27967 [translate_table: standard]
MTLGGESPGYLDRRTLFREASVNGVPTMHPLWMEFLNDEVTFNNDKAFMVERKHWSLTQKYAPKTFEELVDQNLVRENWVGLCVQQYSWYRQNLMCKNICSNTKLSFSRSE